MSNLQNELKKVIPTYTDELKGIDTSAYDDYQFSDKYLKKKEKLIKSRSKIYYPIIKTTGRKIACLIAAAILAGTITVAAYEPARQVLKDFFVKAFDTHTVIIPINNSDVQTANKARIGNNNSIQVPDEYFLDEYLSVISDNVIIQVYISEDCDNSIIFGKYSKNSYINYSDNERSELEEISDKFGNTLVLHTGNKFTYLTWAKDDSIFELSANMSKEELMEIYYTIE